MMKILNNLLSCVRGEIKDLKVPSEVVAEADNEEDAVVVDEPETSLDSVTIAPRATSEGLAVNQREEGGSVTDPGVNTATTRVSPRRSDPPQMQSNSHGPLTTGAATQGPVTEQYGSGTRGGGRNNYSKQLQGTSTRSNRKVMGGASSVVSYPSVSQGLIGATNVLMAPPLRENLTMAVQGEVSDLERSLIKLHNEWEKRCVQLLQQNQDRYEHIYEQQVRQWEILVVYACEDEVKGQQIRELIGTHHKIVTPDPICSPGQNILEFYEKHLSSYIYAILVVSKALLKNNEMTNFVISELLCQENRNIFPLYLEKDLDFPEGLNTISSFTKIEERHLKVKSDFVLKAKLLRYKKEIEAINSILQNR